MGIEVSVEGAQPGGAAAVTATFDERVEARRISCTALAHATNMMGGRVQSAHGRTEIEVGRMIDVGEQFVFEVGIPAHAPGTFETDVCSVNWQVEVVVDRAGPDLRETTDLFVATPTNVPAVASAAEMLAYLGRRRRMRSAFGSSAHWGIVGVVIVVFTVASAIVIDSESEAAELAIIAAVAGAALVVCLMAARWVGTADSFPFRVGVDAARRGGTVTVVLDRPAAELLTVALVSRVCMRKKTGNSNEKVKLWFEIASTTDVGIGTLGVELSIPPACRPTCTMYRCEVEHWVRIMRPQDTTRHQGLVRRRSDRPLYVTP